MSAKKGEKELAEEKNESWKEVEGYERYEVSDFGNVRKKNGKWSKREGDYLNLKPSENKGYKYVTLYKHRIPKQFYIHRLVMTTFSSNTENKPHVNHLNGVRGDNRLINLEYATVAENLKHSYRTLNRTPPMLGKKHSEKAKEKMMENKTDSISVTINGIEYRSLREACRELNINLVTLRTKIKKGICIYVSKGRQITIDAINGVSNNQRND